MIKDIIGSLIGYISPASHDKKLSELKKTLSTLIKRREEQVVNLQKELKDTKEANDILSTERNDLEQQISTLTAKLQEKSRKLDSIITDNERFVQKEEEWANNLISFVSYINLLNCTSEDMPLEEGLRLLKSKYEDIILLCGISILKEYEGKLNPSIQKVVETIGTQDDTLNNSVAKIVNPAYFIGERCIQPMEVVVYCKQK